MTRQRLQMIWTVEVQDESALRHHVLEDALARLEPHQSAREAAEAMSRDVMSALTEVARTRLFGSEIPGVGAMQLSFEPVR